MNKDLRKSYNRLNNQYRFQASNIDKEKWFKLFYDEKSAISMDELGFTGSMKAKVYPYKFYFLRCLVWRLILPFNNIRARFKRYINDNTNVIQAIIGISVLLLTILMIFIMIN